jgi:hypothetical protein
LTTVKTEYVAVALMTILVIALAYYGITANQEITNLNANLNTANQEISNLNTNLNTTNQEITNLKTVGRTLCQEEQQAGNLIIPFIANITATLQSQIQSDKSMVAALESSNPAGNAGMIATLNGEISQDNSILAYINSQTKTITGLTAISQCAIFGP